MKTVNGEVISADSISLSKAASILSKFASADKVASQVIGEYLRRASAASTDLKHLHGELGSFSRSNREGKRSKSYVTRERVKRTDDRNPLCESINEPSHELKKTKEERNGGNDDLVTNEGHIGKFEDKEETRRKKKKNKRSKEIPILG